MKSTIRDEFDFLPKSKIKAGEGTENGHFPFFTSSDVKVMKIDVPLYNDEAVILGTGGNPSCNYFCGEFSVSTDNFVLSSKGRILPKYLYYFLRADGLSILDKGFKGAGLKHISKEYVQNIALPLLSFPDQEAIIGELDTIVHGIEFSKTQISLLDEQVKSLFNEMFLGKCFARHKLENACRQIFAGGDKPADYSNSKEGDYVFPVYANAETNNGLLCFSKTYKVDLPSVTIAARGCTVGFTVARNEKYTPVVRLISIIPGDQINYIFLKHALDNMVTIEGSGAAQPQLTVPTVKQYEISIPPMELQNRFAKRLEQIDKLRFNYQRQIEVLQELMDKKMEEFFGD